MRWVWNVWLVGLVSLVELWFGLVVVEVGVQQCVDYCLYVCCLCGQEVEVVFVYVGVLGQFQLYCLYFFCWMVVVLGDVVVFEVVVYYVVVVVLFMQYGIELCLQWCFVVGVVGGVEVEVWQLVVEQYWYVIVD